MNEHTTYKFSTSKEAWDFMRQAKDGHYEVGYPSLLEPYTVQVGRFKAEETYADLADMLRELAIARRDMILELQGKK